MADVNAEVKEEQAAKTEVKDDGQKGTGGNNEGGNNWWGWINTAKSKSASVFEAVKRDLDEISTVVRTEVSNAGAAIGETLKFDEPESTASTMKKSISTFFGQVSEALVPSVEDDDVEAVLITSDGTVTLTGFQKHLAELQANDATYLSPPDSTLTENYQRWLEVVEQDQFTQNQLAKHLTNSEILNEKYLSLVPEKVSHMEFWKRYLFKRALLEDALANAEIAERRAKAEIRSIKTVSPKRSAEIIQTEQPKPVTIEQEQEPEPAPEPKPKQESPVKTTDKSPAEELVIEDTDIKWDVEDFGSEEISEEEQARLLQEYEAEIQEREKRKSQIVPLEERLHGKDSKNSDKEAQNKTKKEPQKSQAGKNASGNKKQAVTKTAAATKQADNVKTNNINNNNSRNKQNNRNIKGERKSSDDDKNLNLQKNHFKDKEPAVKSLAEDLKTDAGAASDESWEKDFDLSDP